MMKFLVTICCLVAACAKAQTACESPKQWEGMFLRLDSAMAYGQFAKLSYDETNRRARETDVMIGSPRELYDVIYLYNLGKEYRINQRTKQCTVTSLTIAFRQYGVPTGAHMDGEATIGFSAAKKESFPVQNWSYKALTNENYKFYGIVSSPDCVPISNAIYSQKSNRLITTTFYDIKAGIQDPSVFIPPTNCQ